MADGGQGFFKVCMSVIPENSIERNDDCEEDYEPPNKKRATSIYRDGGGLSKELKVTSVKRLIMLCIVPNIKETYGNIAILFDLIKLNNVFFFNFCQILS